MTRPSQRLFDVDLPNDVGDILGDLFGGIEVPDAAQQRKPQSIFSAFEAAALGRGGGVTADKQRAELVKLERESIKLEKEALQAQKQGVAALEELNRSRTPFVFGT